MSPSRLRVTLALVITVVLVADQLTKMWALSQLRGRVIPLAPTLELRLAYNSGFSFGMGATWGPVVAVGVLAVAALLARMALRERDTTRAVLLAAILGGALGNIVDRVFRADAGPLTGHVVDFIAVTWYAVFNVADMFVVCGAMLLAVSELRRDRGTEAEPA